MQLDQRRSPRKTVYKQGVLSSDALQGLHDCVLRSISAHGAMISFSSSTPAPERFDLMVGGGQIYVCRRVWQRDSTVGVEFIEMRSPLEPGTDPRPDEQREERRQHKRVEVLRRGHIIFNGGFNVMECVMLNSSDAGAMTRPNDPMSCPDTFKLSIEYGPSYACRVVRRQDEGVAVEFLDRPKPH